MRQHPTPDPDPYKDDPEALGVPVYEGSGLSVRALTTEELQQFLDAHVDSPPSFSAAAGLPLTHQGSPMGFPGLLQRLRLRPLDPSHRSQWSRAPAASAARAPRPLPSTGGAEARS
jgi:hypothetical protein